MHDPRRTQAARQPREGFTLVELSAVIAILAILVGMAVPAYRQIVLRARAAEAPGVLEAIAHAELQHYRDQGAWLACPAVGPVPAGLAPFPAGEPCWATLGITLDGGTRFRYGVDVDAGGFAVTAEGDLDHDGALSRYRLDGRDFALTVADPLE